MHDHRLFLCLFAGLFIENVNNLHIRGILSKYSHFIYLYAVINVVLLHKDRHTNCLLIPYF